MAKFVVRRMLQAVLVLCLASVLLFVALRLIPGDPALLRVGSDASDEAIAAARHDMALDLPLPVQFLTWLKDIATGSFGTSFAAGVPVSSLIAQAIGPTLALVVGGMAFGIVLGVGLGVVTAVTRLRSVDLVLSTLTSLMYGIPNFVIGLLLVLAVSVHLGWLPTGGYVSIAESPWEALRHLLLPCLVLGISLAAVVARFTRTSMIESMHGDFVRTARAKGAGRMRVIFRHGLRNALLPVITIIGIQLGTLIGGAVVIEAVFNWPGMGSLVVASVLSRDYPAVQSIMVLLVAAFIILNMLTDLAYGVIDPRVRQRIQR